VLLHVVCCAGSAGCGWWRLWGAVLWGASTVKVAVVGRCVVGCEHCEGSGCGALCCRVPAL